jgi:hypothetical protein
MTKLLFVGQNHLDTLLFYGVAQQLSAVGLDPVTATYMRFAYALRPEDVRAIYFGDYSRAYDAREVQDNWAVYEDWARSEYGIADIDRLIISDKALSFAFGLPVHRRDRRKSRAIAVSQLEAWERILEKEQPTHIFTFADGCLIYRTLYAVAGCLSIPTFCALPAPFPDRVFWVDNEQFQLADLPDRPLEDFSAEERAAMEDYLAQVRSSKLGFTWERKRPIVAKLRQIAEYTWVKLRYERGIDHWVPVYWGARYALRAWRTWREHALYSSAQPDERFVFFPLHDPWDSQLGVRAPEFIDQFSLIREVAAALPEGYRLYIKPHPMQVGAYSLRDLRQVISTGRIRLIDPATPAQALIAQADAVVTINSTTGFEGILFRKPVVVVARPFYARQGFTHEVDDLSELRDTLARVLVNDSVPYADEALVRYLLNLRDYTVAGTDPRFYHAKSNEYWLVSEAIRAIPSSVYVDQFAKSIIRRLERDMQFEAPH